MSKNKANIHIPLYDGRSILDATKILIYNFNRLHDTKMEEK